MVRARTIGSPPTLNSIAATTRVSRQTVSNVLNDPDRVAEPTRSTVLEEIRRVGYRPSAAARQLRTRRSQLLGFRMRDAIDGINGSIHDRLLHALTERADAVGYSLLVFAASDDDAEMAAYQRLRATNALDGFLLTSTNHGDHRSDWLREQGIPFVAFGRPWGRDDAATSHDHDWIDIDGGAGTDAATRLLASEGARRIGFIGWPAGSGAGDDRLDGHRRACRELGLVDELVVRCEDGFEAGAAAAAQLVRSEVDAIVCVSDSLALGALAHLRGLGRRDLMDRLVGFDDTPVARAVGISSVDQPIEEAAHRMIDLLVHRIEKPSADGPGDPADLLIPVVHRRRTSNA
ncbi:LacI family DNA-binding transcriptional regulator [Brachybacterium alimentarium]|uniref:LacI family DNA-binding transcriptional regulator n=1 Tax=Brachybacterium alimentarium TaxID=47845 RepID=UPI003FD5B803